MFAETVSGSKPTRTCSATPAALRLPTRGRHTLGHRNIQHTVRYTELSAETSGGASGEKHDVVTAARLKEMGVMPGFPDLLFFDPCTARCASSS